MIVRLFHSTPDDPAICEGVPDYEGPFADLVFPSVVALDEARGVLEATGQCWLDSTTLAVVVEGGAS